MKKYFKKKSFHFLLGWMLPLMMLFITCKKDLSIPSYLHIDAISFAAVASSQGSSSSKITDAWITVDGKFIGAFELPATIPVLQKGAHDVQVEAGITVNGIAASRGKYPYYTTYEVNADLQQEKVTTLTPSVTYTTNTQFAWLESFEGNSFSLEKSSRSDASINIQRATGADAFEGNGSAFISMNASQTIFECQTLDYFALPKSSSDIYLEMNYKTNVELTVGLYTDALSGSYQEAAEILKPTTEWKKIYIDFTEVANKHSDARGHKLFFGTTNNSSVANPQIYLDNAKLVY